MNKQLAKASLILGLFLILISCNESKKQFTVEGTITNADTLTLYLEQRGHSDLAVLDSIKLDDKGNFSFKQNSLGYPEFYRLRLGNQSINFSIDSTETIIVKANEPSFSTDYAIEGSVNNMLIKDAVWFHANLNAQIEDVRKQYNNKDITNEEFFELAETYIDSYKTNIKKFILENARSTAAYYALFLKLGDLLIFDPSEKSDLPLFRTVATTWSTFYPNSPRAEQLKNYTLTAMATMKAEEQRSATLESLLQQDPIKHKDYFTVSLPGIDNKEISTASFTGKVLLLDFTAYQTEYSVMHNMRLNKIYEKYNSKLEIYQVSFDQQKHFWQNASVNLPWIKVWDKQSLQSPLISKFNIAELPTTFILDKNGEVIKKVSAGENLEAEITKIL